MHTLRRFYAPPERFEGEWAVLDREESHHLVRVLRLGVGALVAVFDGRGRNFEAVVDGLEPEGARLKLVRPLAPWGESPLAVTLGIGLAKGEALDEVVRQATEMGVKRIIPFISTRSEKDPPERAGRRRERRRRLAQESLKSSRRSCLPEIDLPLDFGAVLAGSEDIKLFFWEEEQGDMLAACLKLPRPASVRLLIGPEGGFAPAEAAQARDAGFQIVSLGPRRLRVATAALAAIALLQFAWGDLG